MNLIAMLTVDLNLEVTSKKRKEFNSALAANNWKKIEGLTTVWKATFKEDATKDDVINATKRDLRDAAGKAQITDYDAIVHVGTSEPKILSRPAK